jgi:hypothetical protein
MLCQLFVVNQNVFAIWQDNFIAFGLLGACCIVLLRAVIVEDTARITRFHAYYSSVIL